MSNECKPGSEIPGMLNEVFNTLGDSLDSIAEKFIFAHYLGQEAISPTAVQPGRGPDGTQVFLDIRGRNTADFIDFLGDNNTNVDKDLLKKLANLKDGGIRNPDFMNHRPSQSTFEYYEVKPNSTAGRGDGVAKMNQLDTFFGIFNLSHYKRGIHYVPDATQDLWISTQGVMETKVSLHWKKHQKGLIVYEICIDTKIRAPKVSKEAQKNLERSAWQTAVMVLIVIGSGIGSFVFD
jgi:hypothetical protein